MSLTAMLELLVAFILYVCLGIIGFFALMNLTFALRYSPENEDCGAPNPDRVAVIVPVRDDPSIFNSHPSLESMDYPNYKVFITDDSADPAFTERLTALRSEKTEIIRRTEHVGRKAGAINYALDAIAPYDPKFVCIFDCDHRPTRDFLDKAISTIEKAKVDCVCGYQKHDINSDTLFRKYYRAGQACGIVNFKARNQLGMTTIFGGGCGVFRYEWLRKYRFDPTSITEDWELSARAYVAGDFKILIRDDLYAHAAIPRSYKSFVTQQLRWSEGTVADFKKHFRGIITSKELDLKQKVGMFYQGLYYGISIPIMVALAITLAHPTPLLSPLVSLALTGFFLLSWLATYLRGPALEGYGWPLTLKTVVMAYAVAQLMAPVYAWSTMRGLLQRRTSWIVTRRTG